MAGRTDSGSAAFDPAVTANYTVFLGDSILHPEKAASHSSIRFNTKSQSSDKAIILKTDSKTYKARLPRDGSKAPATYTGAAVANGVDKYVLVFDEEKDGFVLDKLDTSFAFNLDAEGGSSVRKISLDEGSETEVDSDGDAAFSDGDPDNPYDYRHFLEKAPKPSNSQRSVQAAASVKESRPVHHRSTPSITKTSPDAKPKLISTPQSVPKPSPKPKAVKAANSKLTPASKPKYASSIDNADNESSTSSTTPSKSGKKKQEINIIEESEESEDDDFRFENDDGTIYKKTSKPQIRAEPTLSAAVVKPKGEPISLRSATNSANHSPMGLGIKLSQEQRRQQRRRHSSESSSDEDEGYNNDSSHTTASRQPISLSQALGNSRHNIQSDSDADLVSAPLNIGSPAMPNPAPARHAHLLKVATPIHHEVSEEEFEAEFEQAFADEMEDVVPTPAPVPIRRPLQEESEESEED